MLYYFCYLGESEALTCGTGKYRSGSICRSCRTGCASCTSFSSCSRCKSGYRKSGSSCIRTSSTTTSSVSINGGAIGGIVGGVVVIGAAVGAIAHH